ncbi:MAG: 2-C-methyl-D-erythritol 4-phosphate cytidylyltransferase [Desulfotomaculum sp. 46_296]|nr:MAG: 2-C-methyl-D-erythritol 4-phosphate cytidylyltransferase [Desulfotomaculum sp. 46_296]KUK84395.1 MAG: 2-C-methyl-D-erythritol 4-phosphate cytidylyltransferase [Desulfofundulus kuznetsovii]
MDNVLAVVVAAGQSRRMGENVNKMLLHVAGRPVLSYSLAALQEAPFVKGFVLVAGERELETYVTLAEQWGCTKMISLVKGGKTRQDSVWEGLNALPADTRVIIVHDGARPLVTVNQLDQVVSEALRWNAAALAVPVKDTVKETGMGNFVSRTLNRESLWLAQTPQAFSYSLLMDAHRKARRDQRTATDDAGLVEAMGVPVKIIEGSYRNIKVTTPEDLSMIEYFLQHRDRHSCC